MDKVYEKLEKCLTDIRKKSAFTPKVALVLGSGLGDYAQQVQVVDTVDYREIRDFPISTVPGHKGRFILGYIGNVPVVVMQGRIHYYEGYSMSDVVLPIRLMALLGAKTLFLTNACGGIKDGFQAGDFMLIKDQIACFVPSPLRGANIDSLGPRFPDMSQIYRQELQEAIRQAAAQEGIPLQEGVYLQLAGPNFETPMEVQMCKVLGADAVGMSTACEAIAAAHMGMKVCGVSCITNLACGISKTPLSHEEVQETADRVAVLFQRLITASITRMAGGKERI